MFVYCFDVKASLSGLKMVKSYPFLFFSIFLFFSLAAVVSKEYVCHICKNILIVSYILYKQKNTECSLLIPHEQQQQQQHMSLM